MFWTVSHTGRSVNVFLKQEMKHGPKCRKKVVKSKVMRIISTLGCTVVSTPVQEVKAKAEQKNEGTYLVPSFGMRLTYLEVRIMV